MATKPGNYDLSIYKGQTLDITFTWRDSAGALVDLTGYTAKMQVRSAPGGTQYAELLSTGGTPAITLGGAAGTIRLQVSATDTTAYTFDRAYYDLEMTVTATGVVTRLLEGQVMAYAQVTV